ncbi:MAG: DUF411 domain-containing protein [Stenotrophomonas sp.]
MKTIAALLLAASAVSACNAAPPSAPVPQSNLANTAADLPVAHVHKDANCGCCNGWIEHMRAAGFTVVAHDNGDMLAVKQQLGIPLAQASCHTAEVGGYVVEGHVPVEDILRLLREKPAAHGLVLPGMPMGSPGMESPDGRRDAFTVALLGKDGTLQAYSRHP